MDKTAVLKERLVEAADGLNERLTAMSDSFYRNPELGLEEHRTSAAMRAFLAQAGFAVEEGVAGMPTAFRAVIGSGAPVIALLAEMDALPGVGHGCGHNIGGTASIGAGAAIAAVMKDALAGGQGTLLVLGTPAEELGKGKLEMIKKGLFEGVDAAMMVHASSRRTVLKNFIGLAKISFTFHGHASHASAYPEEGVNALDAVIQTFNSINALRQQLSTGVRVHGIITDGGRAPNIIPDRAAACFYVRSNELGELQAVKQKVIKCAEGAALATGCSLEAEEAGEMNAPMKLNHSFSDVYRGALNMLGLEEAVQPADRNVGSSDIGNVSRVVPAIHPHVPMRPGINIHTHGFADATVTPDGHRALMEGVKCLGLTAIDLFADPGKLDRIKEEFNETP
ncbi:MAG: M20 family metallopeptidase [Thermodesulfobacteriota bacterium]